MKRNVGVGGIRKDLRDGESQVQMAWRELKSMENERWDELPQVA